jgi:hypothetical protein
MQSDKITASASEEFCKNNFKIIYMQINKTPTWFGLLFQIFTTQNFIYKPLTVSRYSEAVPVKKKFANKPKLLIFS